MKFLSAYICYHLTNKIHLKVQWIKPVSLRPCFQCHWRETRIASTHLSSMSPRKENLRGLLTCTFCSAWRSCIMVSKFLFVWCILQSIVTSKQFQTSLHILLAKQKKIKCFHLTGMQIKLQNFTESIVRD